MELHYHAEIISRGKGHSVIGAVAYCARDRLHDERTGTDHDFTRKSGAVAFEQLYLPKDAPEWTADRQRFWNELERAETRVDSQLARSINIALPHELTPEQMRRWITDHARENFLRHGYAVHAFLHAPDGDGDSRNWHVHLLIPLRRIEGAGFVNAKDRTTFAEKKTELKQLRERAAGTMNRALERYGHEKRVEYRSFKDRGLDREPVQRLGRHQIARARRTAGSRDIVPERRARDLADDAERIRRKEQRGTFTAEIDDALRDLARTDPTLAATFVRPTSRDPLADRVAAPAEPTPRQSEPTHAPENAPQQAIPVELDRTIQKKPREADREDELRLARQAASERQAEAPRPKWVDTRPQQVEPAHAPENAPQQRRSWFGRMVDAIAGRRQVPAPGRETEKSKSTGLDRADPQPDRTVEVSRPVLEVNRTNVQQPIRAPVREPPTPQQGRGRVMDEADRQLEAAKRRIAERTPADHLRQILERDRDHTRRPGR